MQKKDNAWLKFILYAAVMLVGVLMVLIGYPAYDRAARYQQISEENLKVKQSFEGHSRLEEMKKEYRGEKCVSLAVVSVGFLLVIGMGTLLVGRKSATRKAGFVAVGIAVAFLCYAAVSSVIYHARRNAILKRDGARANDIAGKVVAEYLAHSGNAIVVTDGVNVRVIDTVQTNACNGN